MDEKIKKADYDVTAKGKVIESLGGNRYLVEVQEQQYTVSSHGWSDYQPGEIVKIVIPNNDYNAMYIVAIPDVVDGALSEVDDKVSETQRQMEDLQETIGDEVSGLLKNIANIEHTIYRTDEHGNLIVDDEGMYYSLLGDLNDALSLTAAGLTNLSNDFDAFQLGDYAVFKEHTLGLIGTSSAGTDGLYYEKITNVEQDVNKITLEAKERWAYRLDEDGNIVYDVNDSKPIIECISINGEKYRVYEDLNIKNKYYYKKLDENGNDTPDGVFYERNGDVFTPIETPQYKQPVENLIAHGNFAQLQIQADAISQTVGDLAGNVSTIKQTSTSLGIIIGSMVGASAGEILDGEGNIIISALEASAHHWAINFSSQDSVRNYISTTSYIFDSEALKIYGGGIEVYDKVDADGRQKLFYVDAGGNLVIKGKIVAGSSITGSEIYGNTIIVGGTSGGTFVLRDGNNVDRFYIDSTGNVVMSNGIITGASEVAFQEGQGLTFYVQHTSTGQLVKCGQLIASRWAGNEHYEDDNIPSIVLKSEDFLHLSAPRIRIGNFPAYGTIYNGIKIESDGVGIGSSRGITMQAETSINLYGSNLYFNGGTVLTIFQNLIANRLIYASGAYRLSQLAFPVTSGSILRQDSSGAPYWTTILPVNCGGTGRSGWTAGELLYASGAVAFSQISHPYTSGSVLRQDTSGSPYWSATLSIYNGGTGATTASGALSNLGAAPSNHNHNTVSSTTTTLTLSNTAKSVVLDYTGGYYSFRSAVNADMYLGHPSYRWHTVYAQTGSINTSDRNEKRDIADLNGDFSVSLIKGLRPIEYLWENENSTKKNFGFIAQEVEEVINDLGATIDDVYLIHKDKIYGDDGEYIKDRYSMSYQDLMAPVVLAIQNLYTRVEFIEKTLAVNRQELS